MGNPYFWPRHCLTVGVWAGHVDTAGYYYMRLFHLRLQTVLFNEPVSWVIQGLRSCYLLSAVVVSPTMHPPTVCVPRFTVTEPNNNILGLLLCISWLMPLACSFSYWQLEWSGEHDHQSALSTARESYLANKYSSLLQGPHVVQTQNGSKLLPTALDWRLEWFLDYWRTERKEKSKTPSQALKNPG